MLPIDLLCQKLDGVFVGNVFDHESGALVLADALSLDAEVVQRQLTHAWVVQQLIGVLRLIVNGLYGWCEGRIFLGVRLRVLRKRMRVRGIFAGRLELLSIRPFCPNLTIGPIVLLAPLRLELFHLLPVKLDAVGLNLLNDFIGDLPRHIGRLAFSLQPISKRGVFFFRFLSFNRLPLPLLLKLIVPASLTCSSGWFSSLNKGTQVIHWDIELDLGKALLGGGLGGFCCCLFRVFFIFRWWHGWSWKHLKLLIEILLYYNIKLIILGEWGSIKRRVSADRGKKRAGSVGLWWLGICRGLDGGHCLLCWCRCIGCIRNCGLDGWLRRRGCGRTRKERGSFSLCMRRLPSPACRSGRNRFNFIRSWRI